MARYVPRMQPIASADVQTLVAWYGPVPALPDQTAAREALTLASRALSEALPMTS